MENALTMKKSLLAVAMGLTLGLGGCGGGGGDSSSTSIDQFDGAVTSGKAAKGIIQGGLVTAEELDVNGEVVRQVGTTTTNDQGEYELVIGNDYGGGVIRLTIGSDGANTRMKCDVQPDCSGTPFGQPINLPANFSMQALMPPVSSGAAVTTQITPFTHMAVSRVAGAGNGFNAQSVQQAASEVSQIVGVDILTTPPVDITDPTSLGTASGEALQYAAFNAGVGSVLFAAPDGLESALEALGGAFSDGDFDNDDSISIGAITTAVETQATESGIGSDSLSNAMAAITNNLVDTDGDGTPDTYNPEPSDAATLSAVEQAKALVAETRTLVTSLQALQSPAEAFAGNLQLAADVIDLNSQALFETLGMALEAAFMEIDARSIAGTLSLGSFSVPVLDASGLEVGQASVTLADSGGLTITISAPDLNGVAVAVDAASNIPVSAIQGTAFDLSGAEFALNGSVQNSSASISLDQVALQASIASPVSINPDTGDVTDATTGLAVEPVLTGLSLEGSMTLLDKTSSTHFSGEVAVNLVALSANAADSDNPNPISLSAISLGGEFADSANSFTAQVGLTVNNAASFDTIALLDYEADMWVFNNEAGDILQLGSQVGGTLSWLEYRPWDDQTCGEIDGQYACQAGDVWNTQAYFVGRYPDAEAVSEFYVYYDSFSNTTWYNGRVEYPDFETANNYADATLTASLDLSLAGQPDTSLTLTVNRTALEAGDALLSFSHDGHSITIAVEKPAGASGVASVTVTNPDGVQLALSGLSEETAGVSGTLRVDGNQVGRVEETGSGLVLVHYDDGTFETLN